MDLLNSNKPGQVQNNGVALNVATGAASFTLEGSAASAAIRLPAAGASEPTGPKTPPGGPQSVEDRASNAWHGFTGGKLARIIQPAELTPQQIRKNFETSRLDAADATRGRRSQPAADPPMPIALPGGADKSGRLALPMPAGGGVRAIYLPAGVALDDLARALDVANRPPLISTADQAKARAACIELANRIARPPLSIVGDEKKSDGNSIESDGNSEDPRRRNWPGAHHLVEVARRRAAEFAERIQEMITGATRGRNAADRSRFEDLRNLPDPIGRNADADAMISSDPIGGGGNINYTPRDGEAESFTHGSLALAVEPYPKNPNPDQVADFRRFRAKVVGLRLLAAAVDKQSVIAWRVAKLLLDCGSTQNLWVADDMMREDGELYRGTGGLTRCNRKFCVTCSADQRRRARAKIRDGFKDLYPLKGELWRFVTLTSPTLENVDILTAIKIFQRAWALLRKRPFWREYVRAGAKGIEFTVNRVGFHVHIHALVLAKWIPQAQLRDEWTECVLFAWADAGVSAPINTSDGKLIVDVRLVRPRESKIHGRQIGIDAAINEVCKYLTKSCSWDAVPSSEMVAIAEVRRWPRMVEVLGEARAAAAHTSLDTPRLSDSKNGAENSAASAETPMQACKGRAPPLLDLPLDMLPEVWEQKLTARRSKQRAFRKIQLAEKYPTAKFCLLNDDVWDFKTAQEAKRRGEAWRHSKREIGRGVSFTDGSHCPKCAARLISFSCPFCLITIDRRLKDDGN